MLFKFLGNSDAPDWLLSEMNTLSLVSSVRIKFILLQVYNILVGKPVDFDVINRHLVDAKLNESQKRAILTLLAFIIENAVKFDTEPEDLHQELTQLGAPPAHASTINRFYKEIRRPLRKFMKQNFQRLSYSQVTEYRSDVVLSRKDCDNFPQGRLFIRLNNKGESFTVSMTDEQADDLARELRASIEIMKANK